MRSLGCVINDIADRHWDGGVPRTADRPLVTGLLSVPQAWLCLLALACVALGVVLATNRLTVLLSIPALMLALIYPYTKRWFGFPQWVLGCAYAMGTILSYAAVLNTVPLHSFWLFGAVVFWMVATDTLYALTDLPYDKQLGIQSFARWLGDWCQAGIALCHIAMFVCLWCWGQSSGANSWFAVIWLSMILDCLYQHWALKQTNRPFQVFKHNAYLALAFIILAVVGLG
ncbi:MAG: 4-hydroxybenzoate octaprenyltransferase, partial [Pseudomonadota bacterium]